MPSGVTTAMPRSTPASDPRFTNTTLVSLPGAMAITLAASVFEGVADWKICSALARSAVFSSLLQENVLHLQPAQFVLQAAILGVGIVQHDVVVQESRAAAADAFHQARHRRHGASWSRRG